MAEVIHAMDEQCGKITHYTFDYDEPGVKILYSGKREQTRRIFYKTTTTRGTYPMVVSVVQDGAELGITDFVFLLESK